MEVIESVIAMICDLEETPENWVAVRQLKRICPDLRRLAEEDAT